MALFKCKMCGGDLQLTEGNPLVECEYCGSLQTVPSADNEKKLTLFSRANRLRFGCEFDKAAGVYEALVADFPEEAEAYWGLVLCKYGIEYVDDPATGKKIPTCHRSSFDSIMDDSDLEQALENADPAARKVYRNEAKAIEEIRKGIIAVSANEEPYDIFICYKETAENGERTLDSVLAQDVYDALVAKDYRVFFSRITLEDKLGVEYEPYIFAALNSAKVMLVFGTDYEYFNAVWVKNEWSRFLKLMAKDKEKHLIPCYKGIDAYDIPREFAKLQAQDLGKVGATQDLLRGIEKLLPLQIEAAAASVVVPQADTNNNPNVDSYLKRVFMFIEDQDWRNADIYCEKVLDIDPENAKAYLGKLLVEKQVAILEELKYSKDLLEDSANYKKIIRFGEESLKSELGACLEYQKEVKRAVEDRKASELFKKHASVKNGVLNTYMGYDAKVWIPRNITKIGESAFCTNGSVKIIVISDSVTCIENSAFAYCYELEEVTIPDSVTKIGHRVFESCDSLITVTIPDSVTDLGKYTFYDCSNLTTVTLPSGITNIGDGMFCGCKSLASITIPDGVTTIGKAAFMSCSSLTKIIIPNTVTHIDQRAFEQCNNLAIHVAPNSYAEQWVKMWQFRVAGRCQHCGGELKGFFSKTCVNCGKPKDY